MSDIGTRRSRSRSPARSRYQAGDDERPSQRYGHRGYAGGYGDHHYGYRRHMKNTNRGYGRGYRGPYSMPLALSSSEQGGRNHANSIFIGNLAYDATPEDLRQYFGDLGEIVRADIITSRGQHRGMGTVEYTNYQSVEDAIRMYNGTKFMDRVIFVRQDKPPPSEQHEKRAGLACSRRGGYTGFEIFVSNLPYSIKWQTLKDMFKECGEVIHADVSVNAAGYSRGFGTVYVATKEDQLAAIKKWNGSEVQGRILEVRKGKSLDEGDRWCNEPLADDDVRTPSIGSFEAHTKSTDSDATTLDENSFPDFTKGMTSGGAKNRYIYCENMPEATVQSDLYDLFETIGHVIRADLKYDENGNSLGVSICEFQTAEEAEECVERLDSYRYGGCELKISYAKHKLGDRR